MNDTESTLQRSEDMWMVLRSIQGFSPCFINHEERCGDALPLELDMSNYLHVNQICNVMVLICPTSPFK